MLFAQYGVENYTGKPGSLDRAFLLVQDNSMQIEKATKISQKLTHSARYRSILRRRQMLQTANRLKNRS